MSTTRKFVAFTHEDGSQTRAVDSATALVYWYIGLETLHHKVPKDLKPLELHKGPEFNILEGDEFITQIVDCMRRHYNLELKVTLEHLKQLSHDAQCMVLLEFLQDHGKILELWFADSYAELPPIYWRQLPRLQRE